MYAKIKSKLIAGLDFCHAHGFAILFGLMVGIMICLMVAPRPAKAAEINIPRAALAHKSLLIRTGHAYWGLDAPIATFAAQIHAESRWRTSAVSPVGARGMAQFMPATSDWISRIYPHLADNQPTNPAWDIRALVTYDRYLWDRVSAANACNRMAKSLASYNGGLGWVQKDERLARAKGLDPALWFGSVENVNSGRRASAKKENREYPRRILLDYEPAYESAGFGRGMCP